MAADHARELDLVGWKDIASHIGRSVRTAQRWEGELGLPVRRVRGQAADAVFASRAEIDAWLIARSTTLDELDTDAAPRPLATAPWSPGGGAARASIRTRHSLLAALLVLLGAAGIGWRVSARGGPPARWSVVDGALSVRDASGRHLWTRPVPEPLGEPEHFQRRFVGPGGGHVAFRDVDRDGKAEVLVLTGAASETALYCLESDGSLRFRHTVAAEARYGSDNFGPPWETVAAVPAASGIGLWVVSRNTFFPSIVQRLTAEGRVVGEYWAAGHVTALAETTLAGRSVLLVGGTHNEDFTASLAAIDPDVPSGRAPAASPKYVCGTCPPRPPVAYLTLPRPELGRIPDTRPSIEEIRRTTEGIMLRVWYPTSPAGPPPPNGCSGGAAWYRLDEHLEVTSADFVDGYSSCHALLQSQGKLDHAFGPGDLAELLAVRRWPVTPRGSSAPGPAS